MIVLDTHAFLAAAGVTGRLSREATRAFLREEGRRGLVISDVTLTEIATLDLAGKVALETPFGATLREAVDRMGVAIRPVDPEITARAHGLGGTLADPNDRAIVATALELGCPLVTSDGEITEAQVVKTIW